jgi:hypothetical protein
MASVIENARLRLIERCLLATNVFATDEGLCRR